MKQFLRNNGLLILIIALLLAAITAVGGQILPALPNPLSNLLGVVTTPVRNGIASLAAWAEGVYNYSFHYDELEAENQRLRQELAGMEEKARNGEAASLENERLRQLLNLRQKQRSLELESARVTARGASSWTSTLTLSKGSNHDVAVGDCVVDAAGNLVGIIETVGSNWSSMITVVDIDLSLGAFLARTEQVAVLEGDLALMGEKRLKMTYLPENTELVTGDLILTSGLGGNYPEGLVVGYVESLHTDASGMSRYAVVSPATDLDDLVQVFVIKDFTVVE